MRANTSTGVEKKNGGTSGLPSDIGIVVSRCQASERDDRDQDLQDR